MKTPMKKARNPRPSIVAAGLRTFKFLAMNIRPYAAYSGAFILILLGSSIGHTVAMVQASGSQMSEAAIWTFSIIQLLSIVIIAARSIRFTLKETIGSPDQKSSLTIDTLLVVTVPLIVWVLPSVVAVYAMTKLAAVVSLIFPDLTQETINLSIGALALVGFAIYFSRTFCVIPATIFDSRLTIRRNWQETRGKTLSILLTFTVLALPFRFLSAFGEFPFSDRAWEMAPGGELQSFPWVLFFYLNTLVADLGFAVVLPVFTTLVFVSLRQSSDNAVAITHPAPETSEDHRQS